LIPILPFFRLNGISFKNFFKKEGKFMLKTSVSDTDPCGSISKWLPWIRIRVHIGNIDPDPGQSKWCPKRKIKLRF